MKPIVTYFVAFLTFAMIFTSAGPAYTVPDGAILYTVPATLRVKFDGQERGCWSEVAEPC